MKNKRLCLNIIKISFLFLFISNLPITYGSSTTAKGDIEKILPLSERAEIRNEWLKWRFENILPGLMRDGGIDLWLIINREYNEDAVYFTLAPQPTVYSYRTTILILHDKGGAFGVEKLSASDHEKGDWYEGAFTDRSKGQFENLADVIKRIDPKRVAKRALLKTRSISINL